MRTGRSYNMSNSRAEKRNKSIAYSLIFGWLLPIVIAISIALAVNKFVVYKVYIPSGSMIPTLNVGDQLFVTKIYDTNKIKRGDIVVFKSEELNDQLIKRVIGLPGDEIEIKDGVVYINGTALQENYVKNEDKNSNGKFEVPEGKFFFLGDNRPVSLDSSRWSNPYIDAKDIEAKALVRVYPFNQMGFVK